TLPVIEEAAEPRKARGRVGELVDEYLQHAASVGKAVEDLAGGEARVDNPPASGKKELAKIDGLHAVLLAPLGRPRRRVPPAVFVVSSSVKDRRIWVSSEVFVTEKISRLLQLPSLDYIDC